MIEKRHIPVLLNEVLEYLEIKTVGKYVDGTLGLGGHSEEILKRLGKDGRLLGLDVDAKNLEIAKSRLTSFGDTMTTWQVNFRGFQKALLNLGWEEVDGMLFDLGVSSVHLDDPSRGFSFQQSGPLDMRLSGDQNETALSLLKGIAPEKLEKVLIEFGEARFARKLTRRILSAVDEGLVATTTDLSGICKSVIGYHGKSNPSTRVFLAIRSLVNDELGALDEMLSSAPDYLSVGGRIAVISFHSGEDRIVKNRFKEWIQGETDKEFKILTKKPIVPNDEEQLINPRSRSAKLRVLERVA